MLQQWVDLARATGLQTRKSEPPSYQTIDLDSSNHAALECSSTEEANIDEINQWGDGQTSILHTSLSSICQDAMDEGTQPHLPHTPY